MSDSDQGSSLRCISRSGRAIRSEPEGNAIRRTLVAWAQITCKLVLEFILSGVGVELLPHLRT
jgi:hypothetical protein